ncbi:MAG TPA: 2Fe-2S iron-sulfur cluster-binding protein [Dissulfurispiraceae bacterium]|nr:2Fe-2S iron-sulfur cluster-binding protein [Dissulfurispiraceae bacterium]
MNDTAEKKTTNIFVNGRALECLEGQTILDVCRAADIYVPTLCNDRRLIPQGSCRLCIVQIKGYAMPAASCSTPALEGMEIATESDELVRLRRATLELILANHPNDCMCCEKAGRCVLQELAYKSGVTPPTDAPRYDALSVQDDNESIIVDVNKCVRCGRCITICRDVVKRDAMVMRTPEGEDETRLMPAGTITLLAERCDFCGECVTTCPVGSLLDKRQLGNRKALVTLQSPGE